MRALLLVPVAALALAGCQTRITAEKFPETVFPIVVDGATNAFVVVSGGWYVTARSPLWSSDSIKGLNVWTDGKGAVGLTTDSYSSDLSENAVTMAHSLASDFSLLAEKVVAAYTSCGLTVVAGKERELKAEMAKFLSSADVGSTTVTADGTTIVFSDGKSHGECVGCLKKGRD